MATSQREIVGRGRGRARGRPGSRGQSRGPGRRRAHGQGQRQEEDRMADGDFLRVQQLQARRIADEQARIDLLNLQQCQDLLRRCLLREPGLLFHILAENPQPPQNQDQNQPDWCFCTRCRDMPTDIEKKCYGQEPQHLYILEEGVIRLARRIWNDVRAREDPPDPGEDNKQSRYAAYRQFVVWQYGALGRGNKIVIPSCCVWRIRDKYPDPYHQYGGFIPSGL